MITLANDLPEKPTLFDAKSNFASITSLQANISKKKLECAVNFSCVIK